MTSVISYPSQTIHGQAHEAVYQYQVQNILPLLNWMEETGARTIFVTSM